VIAIDGAMIDAAIFDIPDEIRVEEAVADSAFAVDDEVVCLVMEVVRVQRLRGSAMRGPRMRERSAGV
jgi:hypothetical protein